MSISNLFSFFRFFFFNVLFCSVSFLYPLPTFYSLLLDRTENEKRQNEDSQVLPFSPILRPSQITSNLTNSNTFMDAFMKHLQQGQTIENNKIAIPMEAVPTSTPEKKLPKPRKPRDPSAKRKPRKTEETNCTTIGLQIQIRDPETEPATQVPLETNIGPEVQTHPFNSDEIGVTTPSNVISNAIKQQYTPTVPTSNQATYYNMDSSENEPAEQFLYEPEPVYHAQPMNMMANECVSVSNRVKHNSNINHPSDDHSPLQPYNIYSDQKNSASLISRFNVSHTNVSNNPVVRDTMHNSWRGNEIM